MQALEARREQLDRELEAAMPAPSVRLHPKLSEVYRKKIANLEDALNDESIRTEAAEILRSLIDKIALTPDGDVLKAELHGDLATILVFCGDGKKRHPGAEAPGSQLSVVAGARNRFYLLFAANRIPKIYR